MFKYLNKDVSLKGISEWSGEKNSDQWGCEKTGDVFCISRQEQEQLKLEMKKSKNGELITRKNPKGDVILAFKNPIVPKTRNQMNEAHKFLCIRCLNKTGKKCPIEKHLHVVNFSDEVDKQNKRKQLEKKAAKKNRLKKAPVSKKNVVKKAPVSTVDKQKAPVFTVVKKHSEKYRGVCNNICCFSFGNSTCKRTHSNLQKDMCTLWFTTPNLQLHTGGLLPVSELLWAQHGRTGDQSVSLHLKIKGSLFDRYLKIFSKTSTLLCQKIDSINGHYNANAWVPNETPTLDFALHGNGAINTYFKKRERRDQDKINLIREYLKPMVRGFRGIFKQYTLKDGSIVCIPKRTNAPLSKWSENKPSNTPGWKTTQNGKSYRDTVHLRGAKKDINLTVVGENVTTQDKNDLNIRKKPVLATKYCEQNASDGGDLLSPDNLFFNNNGGAGIPIFSAWSISPSTTISPPGFECQSQMNLLKNQKTNLEIDNESLREKLRIAESERYRLEEAVKRKADTNRILVGTIIGKISMMSDSKNWDVALINELLKMQ